MIKCDWMVQAFITRVCLDKLLKFDPDCKFVIGTTTHVVHMTVKPQDIVDEEDAKTAKSGTRDRDGHERSPRCRCVIL